MLGQEEVEQAVSSQVAIRVRGLTKSFGRTSVLRGLDLEVRQGETLAIFGANGSGKTTLIKILATLTKPDAGDFWIGGFKAPPDAEGIRRSIGVVGHNTLLYDDLTAYENLKFYGRMFGLADVEDAIHSVVKRLGLTSRLHQRVRTLSHGLKKRFSLARALLHDPPILLMDEPETGLDQEALERLEETLSSGAAQRPTVLMTTHSLLWGLSIADSVAILSRGRISYQESGGTLDPAGFRSTYLDHTGDRL